MSFVLMVRLRRKSYETRYVEKESEAENCYQWNMLFVHLLEYHTIDK
jgi:hypothetical protein